MGMMTWGSIAKQLRAIGVDVPMPEPASTGAHELEREEAPPLTNEDVAPTEEVPSATFSAAHQSGSDAELAALLAAAKAAGVTFLEDVSSGALVIDGLDNVTVEIANAVGARVDDIRARFLPAVASTASIDLLGKLDVELIVVKSEEHAAIEVARLCKRSETIGLDIETAPRPEFLPLKWPIQITKDGQRSKIQSTMDTSAGSRSFQG